MKKFYLIILVGLCLSTVVLADPPRAYCSIKKPYEISNGDIILLSEGDSEKESFNMAKISSLSIGTLDNDGYQTHIRFSRSSQVLSNIKTKIGFSQDASPFHPGQKIANAELVINDNVAKIGKTFEANLKVKGTALFSKTYIYHLECTVDDSACTDGMCHTKN